MDCEGKDCRQRQYQVTDVELVRREYTPNRPTKKADRKALREKLEEKLAKAVADQTEMVTKCDAGCECFLADTTGLFWQPAGEGRWTDTVTDGTTSLKGTLKYKRETRELVGYCYKPLPKSPSDTEPPGEDDEDE